MSAPAGTTVPIVGAGGNIASHLVAHVGRMAGVRRVVLIDPDSYDDGNLRTQDILRRDVGRPKAKVQARRLRDIDSTLLVDAVVAAVEDVPLGLLRGGVILSGVDSRAARRAINAHAWRLGVPWIDAGVQGDELLARITVYVPGPGQPCLECAWSAQTYALVEQTYPCVGRKAAAPTNAPSALGALAASLQALECRMLLTGMSEHVAVGRQVVVSAVGHREVVTTLRPNPRCRFDHETWHIEPLGRSAECCTIDDVLAIGRHALAADDGVSLAVVGQRFARRLTCASCAAQREFSPHLLGRLGDVALTCDACGGAMRAAGFDLVERLVAAELPASVRGAALRSVGLVAGDVVTVSSRERKVHFEIGGTA